MNADLIKLLLGEHKGKTMTISFSTVVVGLFWGASAGYVPVPATRAYVDAEVSQATKGLPYLVRKEIEHDVDIALYDVQCMRDFQKIGQLERLEREYKELVGDRYPRKTCEELEMRLAGNW